jgi:hypothetical protein
MPEVGRILTNMHGSVNFFTCRYLLTYLLTYLHEIFHVNVLYISHPYIIGSECPGANPTTAIYNTTSSLVCFANKNIFFTYYCNAGVVVVNSEVVGLAPGENPTSGTDAALRNDNVIKDNDTNIQNVYINSMKHAKNYIVYITLL